MDEIQTQAFTSKSNCRKRPLTIAMLPNEFGKKFNGRFSYEKHCWSIKAPSEENTNIIRSLCFSIWCHVVSSSSHIFICNSLLGCFSAATSLGRSSRLDTCLEKLVVEDSDPFVLQKMNQIDVVETHGYRNEGKTYICGMCLPLPPINKNKRTKLTVGEPAWKKMNLLQWE